MSGTKLYDKKRWEICQKSSKLDSTAKNYGIQNKLKGFYVQL